ncbi:hypothetical protein [Paracoccus sp. IB05]|uniref:hypothetical protein n=1 Tax=Paracoccus sp. IB05 TaxID=2779367 RepID=UPI0018E8579A|nr:hypothetical protein [Paracoccus sp. IB05]MBJ2150159.1 hypothetical protein [Paracoccus sp. IB05]
MTSRRYIKRVWRVPKDRGALEYFATLVVKALVKHGWPARWKPCGDPEADGWLDGFVIYEQGKDTGDLPPDFQNATEIAVRIVARTYRVDVTQHYNWVGLNRPYVVTTSGHFKEEK